MKPILLAASLGLALTFLPSCKRDEEIKVYQVAKPGNAATAPESSGAAAVPGADPHAGIPGAPPIGGGGTDPHAGIPGAPPLGGGSADPHAGLSPEQMASVTSSGGPKVSDEAPAHWTKQPGTSMRQASYRVDGEGGTSLDVSLIVLRGAAGGTLDNVNRWRSQLGQDPLDQAGLDGSSQKITTPVGEAVVVDIEGLPAGADAAKDGRILGAIANVGGDAWFYKARGNAALAAKEKDAFVTWVASVKQLEPAGQDTPAPAAGENPPPPAAPAAARPKRMEWQVPEGWAETAGSNMRYATFTLTGTAGAKAELAVTNFPGDVGGDLENVNRWRAQVGLEPVTDAELPALVQKVPAGDKEFLLIDAAGAEKRMLAGWVRHGADTWFFKLIGPADLVGGEKEKFSAFLGSVRFTEAEQ